MRTEETVIAITRYHWEDPPRWGVSEDRTVTDGRRLLDFDTKELGAYGEGEFAAAKAHALEIGRRRGLPVVADGVSLDCPDRYLYNPGPEPDGAASSGRREEVGFTAEDVEEVRPGVRRLVGYDVYFALSSAKEPCARCEARGKVPSRSASGRKTWLKCPLCRGRGQAGPLDNVMDADYAGRNAILSWDVDLTTALRRLNAAPDYTRWRIGPPVFTRLGAWD
jgi:hypothetical protein